MPVKNQYICVECLTAREHEIGMNGSSAINPIFRSEGDAIEHLDQNRQHSMTLDTVWIEEEA